jgi:formate--tetrahydrofolate ligase
MKSSLEIAQEAVLEPIDAIASAAGLEPDEIEPYGRYKAKVSLSALDRLKDRPDGKLICVTGMTPTKAGEGKTTTLVGLTQGLGVIGRNPVACLREASLGPVFGIKGGAAGGGLTQVVPMEDLNLHFTGDIHAIGAANNLLAAMIDASILHGNPHKIDALRIGWRRAVDMNDRALRQIAVGLGGRANGYPRETGFDITAASEVMAILAVARDLKDLRRRTANITAAYSYDGAKPISAEDLGAAGAMTVLLKDAIKPNLVQTLEGQPVLMHCGPFANIAHGNNSLIADLIGMKLGDYVVTESGFGADMGMEKFFDIVCRFGKLTPSAAVLVTTVRAIKHHSGIDDDPRMDRPASLQAIEVGFANVRRHLATIKTYGVPAVVAVNRRPGDTNEEVELVKRLAMEAGAFAAEANEGFTKGGAGAADLAEAVVEACEQPNTFHQIYQDDEPIQDKIEAIATKVYGAKDVYYYPEADAKIGQFTREGLGHFPVCMAKTHLSLSADPTLLNAPEGKTVGLF